GQGDAAKRQAAAELLPRPGQPAAERAGGPAKPLRRLVEGEPLEVVEHQRRAEADRQAVDLAVQRLDLPPPENRPEGGGGDRRGLTPEGPVPLDLAKASQPAASLPGGAQRDAVEPVAQQLGLAKRPGLPGQHQENGLEGVLGMMAIAEELA